MKNKIIKLNPDMRHHFINNEEAATALNVADSVHELADQAKSLITLIQDQFDEDREGRMQGKILYHALSAVSGMIEDMRAICHAYHQATRDTDKQE
ncbi:hypothetical protein [Methylomicrobium agile]|uniref:hypothetical protein n=1 Tax=Methylomicrobium agile TaxID=39774 RepID=UPI0004DFB045|nr:hypothetical protein [Methylomicrobium agile]